MPTGLMPTAHTMRHSAYELGRADKNGPKVAINRMPSLLRRYESLGHISARQREGGERFAAVHRFYWGDQGRSDILAQVVRGQSHETEDEVRRRIKCRELIDEIAEEVGIEGYTLLLDVCIYERPREKRVARGAAFGMVAIMVALNACADVFGMPEEN